MSNGIDWSKPLECDAGVVTLRVESNTSVNVSIDWVEYWVDITTGGPMSSELSDSFKVRNVKTNRDKARDVAYNVLNNPHCTDMAGTIADFLAKEGLLIKD